MVPSPLVYIRLDSILCFLLKDNRFSFSFLFMQAYPSLAADKCRTEPLHADGNSSGLGDAAVSLLSSPASLTQPLRRPHSAELSHSDFTRCRGPLSGKVGGSYAATRPMSAALSGAASAADGIRPALSASTDLCALGEQLRQLSNPFDSYFALQRSRLVCAEQIARCALAADEVQCAEPLRRMICVHGEERALRSLIEHQRHSESWYPWCTAACRYCCTSRFEWSQHTRRSWEAAQSFLVTVEADTRRLQESALLAELVALEMFLSASLTTARLLQAEAATLEAESLHVRSIVAQNEGRQFSAMLQQKQCLLQQHFDTLRHTELYQRETIAAQRDASAVARWRRSLDQSALQCIEDEKRDRRARESEETSSRTYILAQCTFAHGTVQESLWRREHQHLAQELQSLRDYRSHVEATERKKQMDDEIAVRQELLAEFAEIKRLKKQGPPRGAQPLPPCKRCGSVPEKDEFTHRTQECVERPVNCLKCQQVMRASLLERHKVEECPQRIVSCPSCVPSGSYYCKALHYDAVHKHHCSVLPSYRDWLTRAVNGTNTGLGLPVLLTTVPSANAANILDGSDEGMRGTSDPQLVVDLSAAREWLRAVDAEDSPRQQQRTSTAAGAPATVTSTTAAAAPPPPLPLSLGSLLVVRALRHLLDKLEEVKVTQSESKHGDDVAAMYTATIIVRVFTPGTSEAVLQEPEPAVSGVVPSLSSLDSALATFDLIGDQWLVTQTPPTVRVLLLVRHNSPDVDQASFTMELDNVPVLPCGQSNGRSSPIPPRLFVPPSSCIWCCGNAFGARSSPSSPPSLTAATTSGRTNILSLVRLPVASESDGVSSPPPQLCCLHAEYVLRCVALDTANLCKPQVERKGKKR